MKDEVDTILANEQGGFQKNKSSIDNIFWLCNIIQQSFK